MGSIPLGSVVKLSDGSEYTPDAGYDKPPAPSEPLFKEKYDAWMKAHPPQVDPFKKKSQEAPSPPATTELDPDLAASPDLPAGSEDAGGGAAPGYVLPRFLEDPRRRERARALVQAQDDTATLPAPDEAARLRDVAQARALPFTSVLADPKMVEPRALPLSWGQYSENKPLADILLDPTKASLTADEVDRLHELHTFDSGFPGNRVTAALRGGTLGLEENHLWTRKGMNGGVLAPEDEQRLKDIQTSLEVLPRPKNFLDEMVGATPMLAGNVAAGAAGALAGAGVGALTGPAGAAAGASLGGKAGVFAFNADLMIGQNYQQYTQMGMPHDVAWPAAAIAGAIAAGIDTVTFGLLAKVPALKLLSKVPGVAALDKTTIGPAMAAALKDSTFTKLLAEVGKSTAAGATGNVLQELVGILGAYAANATHGGQYQTPSGDEAASRLFHAAQMGGALGAVVSGGTSLFHETLNRAHVGASSADTIARIYDATEGLKSADRAPDVVAKYVNDPARDGAVRSVSLPVEQLDALLEKSGELSRATRTWLSSANIARQLSEARENGTRVNVTLGDFVAFVRPLDKARTLADHVGLNDAMSPAEAKALEPAIRKARKELAEIEAKKRTADAIDAGPEGKISADLEKKLRAVGATAEAARLQADLLTAGLSTLAKRAGKDPWETYRNAPITISRQLGEASKVPLAGETSLDDASPAGVKSKSTGHGMYLEYAHPESPLNLRLYEQKKDLEGNPARAVALLKIESGNSKANKEKFGSQGYSTALYLRALMDAKQEGLAWQSDVSRTDATEKMYARLQRMGIPFQLKPVEESGVTFDAFHLSAEELKKVDLEAAWAKLREGITTRQGDDVGNPLEGASDADISSVIDGIMELQHKQGADVRGFISWDPATRDTFHVTLTSKASLATFVHESSHYLLEIMRKLDQEGGEKSPFAADLRELETWAGVKLGEEWTTEALEKFARGMETFIGEGRAPSAKLAGVFATVRTWIIHVYRTLTNLGAPLTDEVRGVMDRMLATEDEISSRRLEMGYFPDAVVMGEMDPAAQQAYRDLYERGARQAQLKIEKESIAAFRREQSAEYKRLAAQVDEQIDQHPVMKLRSFLDGTKYEGLRQYFKGDWKLDPDYLLIDSKKLGPGIVSKLKQYANEAGKGGIDPEELAAYFSFKDGAEMLTALATTPARATLKSVMVKSEFTKLYPAYGPDKSWVERAALEQLHESDSIANALEIELRVLYKKAGLHPPTSPARIAAEAAKGAAAEMPYKEMRPAQYREAETRMLREQQSALASKDFKTAADAARKRLYNRAMWLEVQKAQDTIERAEKYVKRFGNEDVQGRLGRSSDVRLPSGDQLGSVIRDAAKALVEGTGLVERSYASDTTFDAHVAKLEEAGLPVSIDPVLRERPPHAWEEHTVLEAKATRDALKNLSKLASDANLVRVGERKAHLAEVAQELEASLRESGMLEHLGDKSEERSTLRSWRTEVAKPETIILALDGGKMGTIHKLWMGSAEAGQFENDRRFRLRRDDIKLLREGRPEGWEKMMRATHKFVDGREYTGAEVFSMLQNFGNKTNRDKLIRGMTDAGRTGWTEENVLNFIHEVFPDRAVYDFAQRIFKYISRPDLWEDAAKMREQIAGVRPEKVEAAPIPTPDGGEIEGGYYPLIYNRLIPLKDVEENTLDALSAMQDSNPLNLYAANGFTKERTNYAAPILLNPNTWAGHLYEVDHFISNAQGIIDRHRFLQNPQVKRLIFRSLGAEAWNTLRASNNFIAADGRAVTREMLQISGVFDRLIFHNAILTMGGNILSGVNQIVTGVPATITKLGPKGLPAFARALVEFSRSPFKLWQEVSEQSGEIRDMDFHYDRDLRMVVTREMVGENWEHIRSKVAATTMSPVVFGQKIVNVLTFRAARDIALKEGKSIEEATAYANMAVRQSQSTSAPKDFTAVQRSHDGLMRVLTSLASYTFTLNDLVMPLRLTKGELAGATGRLVTLVLTGAVTKALFNTVFPLLDEKDAEQRKGLEKLAGDSEIPGLLSLSQSAMDVLGNVPVVGRTANALISGRPPRYASWAENAIKALQEAPNALEDKGLGKHALKNVVDTVGLVAGVPSRHIFFAPGEFAYEYLNGDAEDSPWAFFQQLALVRPGQKGK